MAEKNFFSTEEVCLALDIWRVFLEADLPGIGHGHLH